MTAIFLCFISVRFQIQHLIGTRHQTTSYIVRLPCAVPLLPTPGDTNSPQSLFSAPSLSSIPDDITRYKRGNFVIIISRHDRATVILLA